jgi:uncharacterized protein
VHPAIPHLMDLQKIDQQVAALRSDLDGLPKRMREADAKLNSARAAVVTAKEAHTHGLTDRKKMELDVQQWKDRAKKYRDQTGSVKTNEAYKALLHEIANADAEVAKGEDLVLDKMMAIEELERRVRRFEADLKESEQGIAIEKKQIETRYGDEKKKLEGALIEREAVARKVPEDLIELYARIAKKHPGSAMAEVRSDQCRGCGMRVLPHIIQMLRTENDVEVFRCETCGRILYLLDPIPHAAPREEAGGPSAETAHS